ncbi:imidazole glycerol phosphate synthase subunit HisH [Fulvivirgaceae bacterium BMA10]|uniref:Imidazole glycerol phosphate synthase subunit HisH n=1 Tax=Splendidivirga corallicola TaxID=3051826 RepID=A0ABT8KLX6_9BACT|nr:imidazole glycerol phosphate synthase subunit HisH [Fulvivirgaceae bacterium BMA10]
MSNLVIIDYGAGNVQSVKFAFNRLGIDPVLSNDAETIKAADKVIFPGVGEANTAMRALEKFNLEKLIPELKQPVLGICLGMQLMCEYSEENDTRCLGIFQQKVLRFEPKLKVPHMGWNTVHDLKGTLMRDIPRESYVYFVHSYYVPLMEETIAKTDYIIDFSAALQKKNFYACQFHPEKSSQVGEKILKNFLAI